MKYNEEKGNLFTLSNTKYYFAHCISSDCSMSAGIATEFERRYHIRNKILTKFSPVQIKNPTVILTDRVFNLITKYKYWQKPNLSSMNICIERLANLCKDNNIKYLAMPRIGSGLDKLSWPLVRNLINTHFKDIDIEIEVRYL